MNKFNLLVITLAAFTLTACMHSADDPRTVADTYWSHLQNGNIEEAKKLAANSDEQVILQHSNHIIAGSQVETETARTIVSTTITTVNPTTNYTHTRKFDTVLVLQDGQWKVDTEQTQVPLPPSAREEELRMLADELSESMSENIDTIDEAMKHGMEMLNEALQEGSQEMGSSLLELMNELNKSMQESVDKMKERRQQQLDEQQQQQAPAPDPDQGEGMI